MFFFSRLPRSRLGSLAFAVLTCFLLVGMVASTCGGIRGCFSVDCFDRWFLPDSSALGAGLPGLLLLELLPPSCSGCGSSRCPSCSSHPSTAWFSSKTSASWVLTVASTPGSEWAFLSARYPARPSCLLPWWLVGATARELVSHFSLFLSFGVLSLRDSWTGCWRRSSHRVVSSFGFGVALPLLWRWRAREAVSCGPIRSSGRLPGACSRLFSSPLTLPGVVMMFPVC